MFRITTFTVFILILFSLFACKQSTESADKASAKLVSQTSLEMPTLLDRHESLRNGKEWDHVQNFYAAQCATLREDQRNAEARIRLSEVYISEARVTGEHPHYYPAALKILEPVIVELSPKNERTPKETDWLFRALSNKANVQLSLHDFAAALETATRATEINPYNAQIYGALVDANVELGHYAKAVEMADKMVSIRPDLRSYSRISYLREIHGDVPGAIEALNMAIEAGYPGQEPTAWTRLTLGNLYRTYQQWDKAELQYEMVLAERADYPFAMAALAAIKIHKKNYAEGEALLKKACEIIPEVSFYEQLAKLYQATGRKAEFEALTPKILSMMAEDTEKGHDMSLEYAAFYTDILPDYDKALTYALAEYNRRPDNIDVNRRLAQLYFAKKDLENAKIHKMKAAATGSKHPELAKLKF